MVANIPTDLKFVTVPDLVAAWGTTPGKIHSMLQEHTLAAVRVDGVWKIPADFILNDEPLASLRGTILVLLDAGLSEEAAVAWLFADNDELDARPIDLLRRGNKSAVRRATQALAF